MKKLMHTLLCGGVLASLVALSNPAAAAPALDGKININTASEVELDLLPGIGPSIAKKVVDYRRQRPFEDTTHLMRIKGIGRKTYNKLKPFLATQGETTLKVAADGESSTKEVDAGE